MAKTKKLSPKEEVANYIKLLQHPLKDVVLTLRKAILEVSTAIEEQVKWNSLAFYYTGDMKLFEPKAYKRDIVVFNLRKKDFILLVFPTGATIGDSNGLLEGVFPDGRKVSRFSTVEEVKSRKIDLQSAVQKWLNLVEI